MLALLHEPRFADLTPAEVYATLLDEGRYLCSERTMYRVLAENGEIRERRNQLGHPHYSPPELLAARPNQLWSWDITKLLGPANRHLRGSRVFFQRDGSAVDETTLRSWMERAQKQAGLAINKGQIHVLRYTFCSHLAMKNVPPRVIQELAGHADLTTTMRYMHLAKGSKEAAIAVLDQPMPSTGKRGDLVESRPAR